ncbi:MAG: anthranilate synthase component II [Alphaproteobacteria bacterium]
MILIIDNYDSFVYNVARYVRELGEECAVVRNDALDIEDIRSLDPSHIILSPGPRTPAEAGMSNAIIETFKKEIPILGICLGHQCLGAHFGGTVKPYAQPFHGKTSWIHHSGTGLFSKLPDPLRVTRYHSLILSFENLPPELEITAWLGDGTIMAIQHKTYPLFGVQFHPEAHLTEKGYAMLRQFLRIKKKKNADFVCGFSTL